MSINGKSVVVIIAYIFIHCAFSHHLPSIFTASGQRHQVLFFAWLASRFGWDVGVVKTGHPAVKCLAERLEDRSDRSQSPNGSETRLRFFQAGTSRRGTERAEGLRGVVAAWSAWWFRHTIYELMAMF
jgi:hypothetical protein